MTRQIRRNNLKEIGIGWYRMVGYLSYGRVIETNELMY